MCFIQSIYSCMHGEKTGPSISPSCSRLVDAICHQLCRLGHRWKGVQSIARVGRLCQYTPISTLAQRGHRAYQSKVV